MNYTKSQIEQICELTPIIMLLDLIYLHQFRLNYINILTDFNCVSQILSKLFRVWLIFRLGGHLVAA